MTSQRCLVFAPMVSPNPRPSPANPLECAVTQAQLCNSIRMNTCKTPRKHHKIRHFKSCTCNTYANRLCKPFRINRCTKHRGVGVFPVEIPTRFPGLGVQTFKRSDYSDLSTVNFRLSTINSPLCETPAFARRASHEAS